MWRVIQNDSIDLLSLKLISEPISHHMFTEIRPNIPTKFRIHMLNDAQCCLRYAVSMKCLPFACSVQLTNTQTHIATLSHCALLAIAPKYFMQILSASANRAHVMSIYLTTLNTLCHIRMKFILWTLLILSECQWFLPNVNNSKFPKIKSVAEWKILFSVEIINSLRNDSW